MKEKNESKGNSKSKGFTSAEKTAMKARAQEIKAEERDNRAREEGENAVIEAIASMKEPDRSLANRIHAIVKSTAPALYPKTWYGMPAYSDREGKVICFFQPSKKFNTRYSTFGFQDSAKLDDGRMWPVAFALKTVGETEEKRISELVKKAVTDLREKNE